MTAVHLFMSTWVNPLVEMLVFCLRPGGLINSPCIRMMRDGVYYCYLTILIKIRSLIECDARFCSVLCAVRYVKGALNFGIFHGLAMLTKEGYT